MDFWYNPPKDGSKFATLVPENWNTFSSSSKITFSEATIETKDDVYILYAYATEVAHIVRKAQEKNVVFEPQLIAITIHRGDYEKRQKNGDKYETVKCKQSLTEAYLCEILETQAMPLIEEANQGFEGWISFGISDSGKHILLHGTTLDNKNVNPDVHEYWVKEAFQFSLTKLDKLKGVTLTTGEKKQWGSGGFNKSESEAERLKARTQFIMTHLAPYSEKCETFIQLGVGMSGVRNPAEQEYVSRAMEFIKLVLGE